MAVDSRAKGQRGELAARDLLRTYTGLVWERTPGSGALGAHLKLKGDLYVPNEKNLFTIEVKNYESDEFNLGALVNKSNTFNAWLAQSVRESDQNGNDYMMLVKWNRSPWFIALSNKLNPYKASRYIIYENINSPETIIMPLEDISSQMKKEQFIRV